MKSLALILCLLATSALAQSGYPVQVPYTGNASSLTSGTVPAAQMPSYSGGCTSSQGATALTCIPQRPTTTVTSLPTCNSSARGTMYIVTDALLPAALAIVANGGAVVIGVTCNATNWIVQ